MSGEALFKSIVSGENQSILDLMRAKGLLKLLFRLSVLVILLPVVQVKPQW